MVQETYVENIRKIILNQEEIEKELKVKMNNKGKLVFIEGNCDDEYIAVEVVKAIDMGFTIQSALQLKDEEFVFQVLDIKDLTKRNDLSRVRARIIGVHGRALRNLESLTECSIKVHENQIGIIGQADCIEEGIIAIKSLVHGSKHGNVYARLEKKKKEKRLMPKEIIKDEFKKR